ncbi:hypothetical protein HG537_0B03020 [Torulaspora globosa]|uniref:tRNA (adenine(58)-N(1))-methyltransferase non-catalytic subunit TRM6 n=1 Tax=Torulaspora globosa TaxID=48254 RepID=A0A7H9HRH7_9SACH|nr:hypothetical protein HG537_0B03020 [Torulaspora sp. CBS 2947]
MDPLKQLAFDQHVILRLPSGNRKIVQLKPNSSISLGKFGAFHVNDIVGYPLGTTFEIYYDGTHEPDLKNQNRIPVGKIRLLSRTENETGEREQSPLPAELANVLSSANNQKLVNLGNDVQGLSMAQIEDLKNQTASGEEIIAKMIENHGSFDKKTVYSQEKYLKRKKQKFSKFFTAEYLSSSAMLQFLLEKGDVQRVMDMSQESLGMLLNLANIRSNGTYLCVDETGGLLVYFLLERMFGGASEAGATAIGGGTIVVVHENEHPNLDLLKFSNYPESFLKDHIKTVSLLDFFEPPSSQQVEAAFTPLPKDQVRSLKAGKKNAYYRRLKWYNNQRQIITLANETEYDALVIASTLHLPQLVQRLSTRVHGSRPVVCYSQYKETLLELAHALYDDLRFLAPTILETRCRPYQTVRGKLHPLMTMHGGGGYLLWAHRVIPAAEPAI